VGYHGGTFSFGAGARLNEKSAYGMQFYLIPDWSYFAWVRDNQALSAVVTNAAEKAFTMDKLINSPARATLTWDGANLVATLEKGTARWCSTNAFAAVDLPARFPNGAYLGTGVDGVQCHPVPQLHQPCPGTVSAVWRAKRRICGRSDQDHSAVSEHPGTQRQQRLFPL